MKVEDWRLRELVTAYNHARQSYELLHKTLVLLGIIEGGLELPGKKIKEITLVKPNLIVANVQEFFKCNLKEKTQVDRVSKGRQAAHYLFHKYTGMSLRDCVLYTGQKDHTSASQGIKKCIDRMETDEEFKNTIQAIERKLDSIVTRSQIIK